ncbi:FxsA family protein [Stappia sp. F7233]|uniref:FxsA family protein n=1 Tax=Stappia albiluteola TaxID=2758565 RepID=A0A839AIB5_9HYPH|nr:FxsA family protein [Stappia albiluteola]MBA5778806.1 FxsA family protein [Stappia albiluteola]
MPIGLLILAALIGLPLIEIYVFVAVGSEIGALPTILLTVATAVAGTIMLRVQGISLLMRIRNEMEAGRVPADDLVHGALMVVAGILLLIPGFVTDAVGLLLFIPAVRSMIGKAIVERADITVVGGGGVRRPEKDVVDLDEGDWSRTNPDDEADRPSGKRARLSPWRDQQDR